MEYGGAEIKIVMTIDRKWKWSVELPGGTKSGKFRLRESAVAAAKNAIDRSKQPPKMKLARPTGR